MVFKLLAIGPEELQLVFEQPIAQLELVLQPELVM
jgi:hypothetical protein